MIHEFKIWRVMFERMHLCIFIDQRITGSCWLCATGKQMTSGSISWSICSTVQKNCWHYQDFPARGVLHKNLTSQKRQIQNERCMRNILYEDKSWNPFLWEQRKHFVLFILNKAKMTWCLCIHLWGLLQVGQNY